MQKLLAAYLNSVAETTKQGDAREESYYSALEALFSDFPLEKDRRTKVTVLPKATEAGNPDFRVWDGDKFVVGYIEAKIPGTNLDQVENSEQLERYRQTFPNLILTDFYEFRLYRNGLEVDRVTIARHFTAQKLRTTPKLENSSGFQGLAERFFSFKLPLSYTAESLAVALAKRTRFLRDQVVSEELKQAEQQKGGIYGFYQAFQKYLLPNLSPEQFADLYSQTITYGLFAARTRSQSSFNRRTAIDFIPSTVGILRDVFKYISLERISEQMEVIVDDIVSVLNVADINSILDQYYRQGKGEDPIVHFYETFLNQYDPQTRERRGVYYTPEPVVKYIVKSVHQLLKTHFDMPDGLADPSVTLLDPAAGTLTFPAEAIKLAVKEYVQKYGEGGKNEFISNQILRNFYAFELMMAPYAIGHLKISFLLESLGYQMKEDERFKLYLTNTLEMEEIQQIPIPGVSSLSEESHLAGQVKKDKPVLVIVGNPPYSGNSANKNIWTEKLLKEDLDGAQSYYKVDNDALGEQNSKMLQDDYVKFLRFAQWKVQRAGKGIVAMITNHAYLDNLTFRGMRQSLMKTFDEIFILDLHGNSMKNEISPDGSKDENVFDIRVGVVITLFIKKGLQQIKPCNVEHAHLFGNRQSKYLFLKNNDVSTVVWKSIEAKPKFYMLTPRDYRNEERYYQFPAVTEIFQVYSTGVKTHRDGFAFDFNEEALLHRIQQLRETNYSDDLIRQMFKLEDTRDWKLSENRRSLSKMDDWKSNVSLCDYRPFDKRFLYYHPTIVELPKLEVMRHMLHENLGLITVRQVAEQVFNHSFVTDTIVSNRITASSKGMGFLFPLYLYKDNDRDDLFSRLEPVKVPNFSVSFMNFLSTAYSTTPTPEATFAYIYAIMFSKIYRENYVSYLRSDFPRIPFTGNLKIFDDISDLGRKLISIHLMKSLELNQPIIKYQGESDDHSIIQARYNYDVRQLHINSSHFFEGIRPEVWEYQIGGYQVLGQYLKERKGRKLDDPRHFIRIATALSKTIEIQKEIDAIYPEVEENILNFVSSSNN